MIKITIQQRVKAACDIAGITLTELAEKMYTVARREINGVAVGVLDREKADLLEYAVEQAEAAEKLNWRYIEGIYRNFLLRDIKTADEAYQYDLSRSIPALQL